MSISAKEEPREDTDPASTGYGIYPQSFCSPVHYSIPIRVRMLVPTAHVQHYPVWVQTTVKMQKVKSIETRKKINWLPAFVGKMVFCVENSKSKKKQNPPHQN